MAEPRTSTTPAFYARRGGLAADWWTLLHPPYTLWHLSYVVLGAALGELCGRVVTSFHASRSRVALAPMTFESGAGLALVGTW